MASQGPQSVIRPVPHSVYAQHSDDAPGSFPLIILTPFRVLLSVLNVVPLVSACFSLFLDALVDSHRKIEIMPKSWKERLLESDGTERATLRFDRCSGVS